MSKQLQNYPVDRYFQNTYLTTHTRFLSGMGTQIIRASLTSDTQSPVSDSSTPTNSRSYCSVWDYQSGTYEKINTATSLYFCLRWQYCPPLPTRLHSNEPRMPHAHTLKSFRSPSSVL